MSSQFIPISNSKHTQNKITWLSSDLVQELTKAFSGGLGVDEKILTSHLGKSKEQERKWFWKVNRDCFIEDGRPFHRWGNYSVKRLTKEFFRFNILVALVSAYRYEGSNVKVDNAKSDAKELANAIKNAADHKKSLLLDDQVIRILSTRSKPHLKAVYEQYKKISNKSLDEDLGADLRLRDTFQCLYAPEKYFTEVLDAALKKDADKKVKKALTREIVTQADTDNMKQIKEEFQVQCGVALSKKIADNEWKL